MKTRPLVYIAGPFRGPTPWAVERNVRSAETAGLAVAKLDAVPVIPHTMYRFFQDSLADDFWLAADSQLLLKCDALFLCEGWRASRGTLAEKALAFEHGLAIFDRPDLLQDWIARWEAPTND